MRISDFTEERHGVTEARGNDPNSEEMSPGSDLRRLRFFDEGFLTDNNDDAGIADVEAAAVGFEVVADLSALGEAHVAVNDGAADARVAADIHVIVDDGI